MEEQRIAKAHKLVVNNRKTSTVTGVLDVLSFDLNEILLETEQGMLMVKGTDLHVNRLTVEKGGGDLNGEDQDRSLPRPELVWLIGVKDKEVPRLRVILPSLGEDLHGSVQNQIYLKFPVKMGRSVQNPHQKQVKSTNVVVRDQFILVLHVPSILQNRKFVIFFLQLCGGASGGAMLQ